MSDRQTELTFEASRGQAQFAYFQLGLAASAIAFAVHETNGKALADTPWPIGVGVSLWALSFALGCFGIHARHQGLIVNARFLMVSGGSPINAMRSDPEVQSLLAQAKDKTQAALDRPYRRFRLQLWLLFAGAIAYVIGHVVQMAHTPSVHAGIVSRPTIIAPPSAGRH